MQWMRVVKKDSTFRKVIETQKDLKDTEDLIDWSCTVLICVVTQKPLPFLPRCVA